MRIIAKLQPSAAEAQQAAFELVLWFGGIVIALLAAILVLIFVRRRFFRSGHESQVGFTLEGIKGMRDRGELSPEEYKTLRRNLLGLPPETSRK